MSDLISREWLLKQPLDTSNYPSNYVKSAPSADIMECAKAIKEYCRDRDNLDEPCEDCPFHFYDGFAGFCVLNFGLYPNEWTKPDKWHLPEGEKKSCITCKNNDDEFSGECYECVKNIQNHYEPEGEKE